MGIYSDQQSRLVTGFCHSSTSCVCDCACGRVYFVSADGHGDYEEGELERFQKKAREQPGKYIEESTYDTVDMVHIGGKQIVPHCECGEAVKLAKWIEEHAEGLAAYLTRYFDELKKAAENDAKIAEQINDALTKAVA